MSRPYAVVIVFNNEPEVYGQFATPETAERTAGRIRDALGDILTDPGNETDVWVTRINYSNDWRRNSQVVL